MKLKLDENLPDSVAEPLSVARHDVSTVLQQGLAGAADPTVLEICQREHRVLITLDKGFGNVRLYPPESFPGIVVLRPSDQSVTAIRSLLTTFAERLAADSLAGELWIVEPGHIRVYGADR